MKILFRVLAIIFAISVFGNIIKGNIFIVGIILTALFAYLGWRTTSETTVKKEETKPKAEPNPELLEFANSYTEEQKAAMMYILMLMVASEGDYDTKKFNFLNTQAKLLSFDLEGKSMDIYQHQNADYAYSILKLMNDSQKEWFSVTLGSMISLDKRPTLNEEKLIDRILSETNISDEQFKNANLKARALWNKFNP
jgi:hypothetical protein